MDVLRTPDDRFQELPGFGFEPHYTVIDDQDDGTLRVHHLDEGPADAPVVLLLHGEPSWCYLYRHMIPVLTGSGLRVIAPRGREQRSQNFRIRSHDRARLLTIGHHGRVPGPGTVRASCVRGALISRPARVAPAAGGSSWGGGNSSKAHAPALARRLHGATD